MNIWLLIALMALVIFLPRYLPMGFEGKAHFPELIERGLVFVPVAVLTAIIAQKSLTNCI
jgi:branched-subunit amino acid transport protein